jgi:hypothetical protein
MTREPTASALAVLVAAVVLAGAPQAAGSLTEAQHQGRVTAADTANTVLFNLSTVVATGLGGAMEVTMDIGTLTDGTFCNLTDPTFQNMVRALDYNYLRVGGTEGDLAFYDMADRSTTFPQSPPPAPFTRKLSGGVWDLLVQFAASVGTGIVFGLNAGPWVRNASTNAWIPDMANAFIEYNEARHRGAMTGYEFGNEPNLYPSTFNVTPNGTQWAADMAVLRDMLNAINPGLFTLCCDVTYLPLIGEVLSLQQDFMAAGGHLHTDIATWHYYPLFSAKMNQWLPEWMDPYYATPARLAMPLTLNEALKWAYTFSKDSTPPATEPIATRRWLGETASVCFGGQDGVSNAFVDSLASMDKVGLITRLGHQKSFRQEICATHWTNPANASASGHRSPPYALIDLHNVPLPTYFTTYTFRSLVGDEAFASASSPDDALRAYLYAGKVPNTIVATLVNPQPAPRPQPLLCFAGVASSRPTDSSLSQDSTAELYELTGCTEGLTSRTVCLNGVEMTVDAGGNPSPLVPVSVPLTVVSSALHNALEPLVCVSLGNRTLPGEAAWLVQIPLSAIHRG